jgi:hypothetical protein
MTMLRCTRDQLIAGLRAAATVEAMLTGEDWLRRYHYTKDFHQGVDLATFSNGGGDDMSVLSSVDGVIIKGFDHESEVSPYCRDDHSPWPGIFDGVPPGLLGLLDDPAICKDDITFLHWLPAGQHEWLRGPVTFPNGEDDGSDWLLSLLPVTVWDYMAHAETYFGEDFKKIDSSIIYHHFG